MTALEQLAQLISSGLPPKEERAKYEQDTRTSIEQLFGERYQTRSKYGRRCVLMPSDDQISFAGLVHEDSPSSGVYGGMSLIWFPIPADESGAASSLLTFVCGTRGLSPDEQILGRPGHERLLRALQRHINQKCNVDMWVKQDPTDLAAPVPKLIQAKLDRYADVLKRYGNCVYACVDIPSKSKYANQIVTGFLNLYAWERGWSPLKKFSDEIEEFKVQVRGHLFPRTSINDVAKLLEQRKFVILQGPPGTGKTRMAIEILKSFYSDNGFSIQFHPAVSYESFISGISPRVESETLTFQTKDGWLLQAIDKCESKSALLHIDEINRADLSRVLGEALYLFEPREISSGQSRAVQLQSAHGKESRTLSLPQDLHVLGTMNSADRSIAIMDMAVRRRFAFVDIWPDIEVINSQSVKIATTAFAELQDIFTQFATDDSFNLLPGHSYFLASSEEEFRDRMRFELLPLLKEYLLEGRLSSCDSELRAYIDSWSLAISTKDS